MAEKTAMIIEGQGVMGGITYQVVILPDNTPEEVEKVQEMVRTAVTQTGARPPYVTWQLLGEALDAAGYERMGGRRIDAWDLRQEIATAQPKG